MSCTQQILNSNLGNELMIGSAIKQEAENQGSIVLVMHQLSKLQLLYLESGTNNMSHFIVTKWL